jgi:hypothetical protein
VRCNRRKSDCAAVLKYAKYSIFFCQLLWRAKSCTTRSCRRSGNFFRITPRGCSGEYISAMMTNLLQNFKSCCFLKKVCYVDTLISHSDVHLTWCASKRVTFVGASRVRHRRCVTWLDGAGGAFACYRHVCATRYPFPNRVAGKAAWVADDEWVFRRPTTDASVVY